MVFIFISQSEGTNPKGSHTAGTEYTTRNRVFAVSASRGDVGLNLYRSGTISTNLTPSSIPLFQACAKRNVIRTELRSFYIFLILTFTLSFAILNSWDFEDMRELRSVTAVPPRADVEVSFFIFNTNTKVANIPRSVLFVMKA